MAIATEEVSDLPIYIIRATNHIAPSDLKASFAYFAEIANQSAVYRIVDLSQAQTPRREANELAYLATTHLPGSFNDPRITTVLVSDSGYPQIAVALMSRYGMALPVFHSVKDAVSAIKAVMV